MRRAVVIGACCIVLAGTVAVSRTTAAAPSQTVIDPHRCTRALDGARSVIAIAGRAIDVAREMVGRIPTAADVHDLSVEAESMHAAAPRWARDAQLCRAGAR